MLWLAIIATFLLTWLMTWRAEIILRQRNLMDIPNERSSHSIPTPKGGGIAILAALLPWSIWFSPPTTVALLCLGLLSLINDKKEIPGLYRLMAHFILTLLTLWLFPFQGTVFQELLPMPINFILSIFILVWFTNLYNFMDGIDGITGVETISLSLGLFIFTNDLFTLGIAAIALGFLMHNWHPARIFMGDVGSIPLGFILGFLLLNLAAKGLWLEALILPLYYLTDATFTLLKRALKGENVLKPHRQHFYQQAVQKGLSHSHVSLVIAFTNIILIVCAWAGGSTGVIAAFLVVTATLLYFKKS